MLLVCTQLVYIYIYPFYQWHCETKFSLEEKKKKEVEGWCNMIMVAMVAKCFWGWRLAEKKVIFLATSTKTLYTMAMVFLSFFFPSLPIFQLFQIQ